MSTNIVAFSQPNALANFNSFVEEEYSGAAFAQYLKFTKLGEFIFGMEEEHVGPDEEFAVNMATLAKGYICWKDGRPAGEEMKPVTEGVVLKGSLPDYGEPWKEQVSIEFESLEDGIRMLFKTSTSGGRKAIASLAKAFADRMKTGAIDVVPVVKMTPSSYKHKEFGKVFVPTFPVAAWLTPAGVDEASGALDDEVFEAEVIEEVKAAPSKRRGGFR